MRRKISARCFYPGDDGLLHVGVCRKSLGSHLFLKGFKDVETNDCKIENVGNRAVTIRIAPSDSNLFGFLGTDLDGKRSAA